MHLNHAIRSLQAARRPNQSLSRNLARLSGHNIPTAIKWPFTLAAICRSLGGIQYYATSYYFPTTWAGTQIHGDSNSWSIIAQFHPTGNGTWGFFYAAATSQNGPENYWMNFGGTAIQFSDGGAISLGKWSDFVIEIIWGSTNSTLSVWRRDEGQSNFTEVVSNQNVTAASGSCYFKQGLYRGGDVNGRTDVFWFGPTARGSTFSAVEQAAFGTNVGL
jgi:hypothetical protein